MIIMLIPMVKYIGWIDVCASCVFGNLLISVWSAQLGKATRRDATQAHISHVLHVVEDGVA